MGASEPISLQKLHEIYFKVACGDKEARQVLITWLIDSRMTKQAYLELSKFLENFRVSTSVDNQDFVFLETILAVFQQGVKSLIEYSFEYIKLLKNSTESDFTDSQLQRMFVSILHNDKIRETQKYQLLEELLIFYAIKLKETGDKATQIDYHIFLKGLDLLLGLSNTQIAIDKILQFYEGIPLQIGNMAIYAEAQMRLADYYYSAILNSGHNAKTAYRWVKTYQENAKSAFINAINQRNNDSELQQSFAFYRIIIEDRENNAKKVTLLKIFLEKLQSLLTHIIHSFFKHKEEDKSNFLQQNKKSSKINCLNHSESNLKRNPHIINQGYQPDFFTLPKDKLANGTEKNAEATIDSKNTTSPNLYNTLKIF